MTARWPEGVAAATPCEVEGLAPDLPIGSGGLALASGNIRLVTEDADNSLEPDEDYGPAADLVDGLNVWPLPPGWGAPERGFFLVQCPDDEGHLSWAARWTPKINKHELLGALRVQVLLLERDLIDIYEE